MASSPRHIASGGSPEEAIADEPVVHRPISGRRVLVLAPFPPQLDGTHGGSRTIAHIITALADRNRIALAYLRAEDEPPASAAVTAACERVVEGARLGVSYSSVHPWPRALAVLPSLATARPLWVAARWNDAFASRVAELACVWRPDVVQAEFSAMGQYLAAVRGYCTRTVVTIHDPGAEAALERIAWHERGGVFWRLDAKLWAGFERSVLRAADAVVVFTTRDRTAMERLDATARLERIPLGVTIPMTPADPHGVEPPTLLFVGNSVHPPNTDAVNWLLTEIFPPLRQRFPALRLCIVGGSGRLPPREPAAGVMLAGEVPDLAPYLERAAMVVAPLRRGGGMRVKVMEALAAGKAVVATRLGVEGLDLDDGKHALLAESSDAFVDAVARLLEDREYRVALARAGRAWVASRFNWTCAAEAYEALYERLLHDCEL